MPNTSSTQKASTRLAIALQSGQPIYHIATDDFDQMKQIVFTAYYNGHAAADDMIDLFERASSKDKSNIYWTHRLEPGVYYAHPNNGDGFDASATNIILQYAETQRTKQLELSSLSWAASRKPEHCLILYGSGIRLSGLLSSCVQRIEVDPLSTEDYGMILRETDPSHSLAPDQIQWYSDNLGGYNEHMTRSILTTIINSSNAHTLGNLDLAKKVIAKDKNKRLTQHNKLTCMDGDAGSDRAATVVGLGSITTWLDEHKRFFHINAERHSADKPVPKPPKGMLLVGIPGTGKSETAKEAARRLGLSLIRLDMGRILGGLVGDSEHNMEEVLQDLLFVAPCVLWIDELEKAMSGADGRSGDSGVMERLLGMLLTFMQEMTRPVFVVATANDISRLPPEFFRNGRFDVRFCLMMPSFRECVEIMDAKLRRYGIHDPSFAEELTACSVGTQTSPRFLTGADISAMVDELLRQYLRQHKAIPAAPDRGEKEVLLKLMRQKIPECIVPYGDASRIKNIDDIAERYCDMLQRALFMAGDQTEQPQLFQASRFHPERIQDYVYAEKGECPTCMDKPVGFDRLHQYDQWLYENVTNRMDIRLAKAEGASVYHDFMKKRSGK